MAASWCKVASNLDSHPKIRKAGRNGREVFLFALRRNAEPGNPVPGRLPMEELEPWYLADQLQMPECDAVTGVTAAVTAGLLAIDGASYLIVSWKDGWGKDNGNGADRTAKWRENKRMGKRDVTGDGRDVTGVTRDSGDTDQRRGEEKRLEEKREKAAPSGKRKTPEFPLPSDWRPTSEHATFANKHGIDLDGETLAFRLHAEAHDRRAVRWNAAFAQWLHKSSRSQPRQGRIDGLSHVLAIANGEIP